MARSVEVSAIIPTYNRRELVQRAIDCALAQTRQVDEIIVVDDGSTDGTADALAARYGNRIHYVRQANAGVSAARNHGMALATGRFIALLDSDDLWMPEKTARQVAFLEAHPDFGMVLCDVRRVEADGTPIDVFRRRDVLPVDGWVLGDLLANPALAPASAIFLREVVEDVGGFDESLRTAEDIDFHLRVARRWRIGVVEEVLVEAIRGHDGLSAGSSTYDDYVRVVEHAVAGCEDVVPAEVRHRALAATYVRNARGMLLRGRWHDAARLATRAWRLDPDARRQVRALLPFGLRRALALALGR